MQGRPTQPPVRTRWRAPEVELAPIRRDLENPAVALHFAKQRDQAFTQARNGLAGLDPAPRLECFAKGSDVMDRFVGTADVPRPGHVARYIRARALAPVALGAKAVLTDPAPDSERAVRAFRRAGLVPDRTSTESRGAPVLEMHFACLTA